jgi:4-hydroxybenzoate polyprenyltransferase
MSALRPYAQLVRLPNLPTAFADIGLAALAVQLTWGQVPTFVALLLSSACLYCGGMVWNDFFDVEQDRRERAFRPIPSGAISRREAGMIGAGLLGCGLLFAVIAGFLRAWGSENASFTTPPFIAILLSGAILAYDGWLKRTWAGPLAMGSCRLLNVLLGLTVTSTMGGSAGTHLACVVGLYIVGVTWLARTEARESQQGALLGAALVLVSALALALPLPVHVPPGVASPLFPYLLIGLGFWLGLPVVKAVKSPTPAYVQAAVKRVLMGLILLDATLATALAGTVGLVLLVLLVPSLYLNRRRELYAT